MPPKIAVITGPTATGKTKLGVLLAKKLSGEVVSADSMQVYRRMDIGTAKPTALEMDGVPHHMIDVCGPERPFSVSRYVELAADCCGGILSRGALPILVGGTGLYIDSLISGRDFAGGGPAAEECREELSQRYDEIGGRGLLRELAQLDPERAARLSPGDKKRIVRAYEVFLLTGRTITEHDRETCALPPRYDARIIALDYLRRQDLYDRIDARVDAMAEAGLFAEVAALLERGLSPRSTAMQAIGYKEAAAALRGRCTAQQAVEDIKQASRRYAKRQLTWLRGRPEVGWIRWDGAPDFDYALQFSTAFLGSAD